MKRQGFADSSLEGDPTGSDFIELFASKQNAESQFYCNRQEKSAFLYHSGWLQRWKQLYANPRFSQLLRVLVNVAIDRARLVLVVPEGEKWESKGAKWKELLETLTILKIILPDLPMYSQDGSDEILPKPSWRTCLYLLDGDTKPVPMEELDQEEVQWVTRQKRVGEKQRCSPNSLITLRSNGRNENLSSTLRRWTWKLIAKEKRRPVQQTQETTPGIRVCRRSRFTTPKSRNQ